MKFGLTKKDIEYIAKAVSNFPKIQTTIIFGSRAMGNFKAGSDVDLAIKGPKITHETVNSLSSILNEELPLPYYFDVIHYDTLESKELKTHIDKEGKMIN